MPSRISAILESPCVAAVSIPYAAGRCSITTMWLYRDYLIAMKPCRGPPMTLGSAAAAHLQFWCRACGYRSEPDPAEQARWYDPETTGPDWGKRLVLGMRQPLRQRHQACGKRAFRSVLPRYSDAWPKDASSARTVPVALITCRFCCRPRHCPVSGQWCRRHSSDVLPTPSADNLCYLRQTHS